MPKLKQLPRLLTLATNVLIDLLVTNCHKCSTVDEIRQYITFVKEDIGPYIPWRLAADFYGTLLEQFSRGFRELAERPKSYRKAVLEVIMDRKLVGLKFTTLEPTDMQNAHRIQGLEELRLCTRCPNLETLHLEDLRVLVYYGSCTDSDLEEIGKYCSKLEFLDIRSDKITNDGLLALCSCSELRDLFLQDCKKLTYEGIRDFLSANTKIQTFHIGSCDHGAHFNGFANAGWSVYPFVKELAINIEHIENGDLLCITEKFPNLISLSVIGGFDSSANLSTLASLNKLTKLEVCSWKSFRRNNFKALLKLIGANITSLQTGIYPRLSQSYLDFVYMFCPNIELLDFYHLARFDGEILVIPPFKRLRKLKIHVWGGVDSRFLELQFGIMPRLEEFGLCEFLVTTEMIESMILDDAKFPNLMVLNLENPRCAYDIRYINDLVKSRNLDIAIHTHADKVRMTMTNTDILFYMERNQLHV